MRNFLEQVVSARDTIWLTEVLYDTKFQVVILKGRCNLSFFRLRSQTYLVSVIQIPRVASRVASMDRKRRCRQPLVVLKKIMENIHKLIYIRVKQMQVHNNYYFARYCVKHFVQTFCTKAKDTALFQYYDILSYHTCIESHLSCLQIIARSKYYCSKAKVFLVSEISHYRHFNPDYRQV